jgi:hypothetical protein
MYRGHTGRPVGRLAIVDSGWLQLRLIYLLTRNRAVEDRDHPARWQARSTEMPSRDCFSRRALHNSAVNILGVSSRAFDQTNANSRCLRPLLRLVGVCLPVRHFNQAEASFRELDPRKLKICKFSRDFRALCPLENASGDYLWHFKLFEDVSMEKITCRKSPSLEVFIH